jgi:hypothetical protein
MCSIWLGDDDDWLSERGESQALDRAMQRAFGENLRTIRPPGLEGYQVMLDFQYWQPTLGIWPRCEPEPAEARR